MSKVKKGKRGERGGKERSKPYKIIGKEVEVIGESSKKKKKDKEKEKEVPPMVLEMIKTGNMHAIFKNT